MGLKESFYEFRNEKFLSNLRPKNVGSLISLKILRDIKHQKLFFYYNSKNSYNSLMGLKTTFYEFGHEKFLCNLRPKNVGSLILLKILRDIKHQNLFFIIIQKFHTTPLWV